MAALTVGTVMIIVTVAIHAIGSAHWLTHVGSRHVGQGRPKGFWGLLASILSTATVLLLLHVVEALLWAVVYVSLPAHAGLTGFREAVYFSMVTFTTLGYGDVTLSPEWGLLAGMEAMVGITVFGLTTALLFMVIQQSWKVSHGRSTARHDTTKGTEQQS